MSNKGSPTAASPMIYDPVSDGTARTTKTMQFVAAVGGKFHGFVRMYRQNPKQMASVDNMS